MAQEYSENDLDREITLLQDSPYVALARRAQRARYQKQQKLYQLRWLEKRGRQLHEAGVTMESLAEQMRQERATWVFPEDDGEL